jgi:hypothetical protein
MAVVSLAMSDINSMRHKREQPEPVDAIPTPQRPSIDALVPKNNPTRDIRPIKSRLPHSFVFTDEFRAAYEIMENTTNCVFITGKAGTGKSTLISYFLENTKKSVVCLAPTGIAALNVHGKTIHSFFKFPLHFINADEIRPDYRLQEVFRNLQAIIIDEISMARADIIDGIDASLRINRKSSLPFGGVQMIFIGDMYQLPPVVSSKEIVTLYKSGDSKKAIPLKEYFEMKYGGFTFSILISFLTYSLRP